MKMPLMLNSELQPRNVLETALSNLTPVWKLSREDPGSLDVEIWPWTLTTSSGALGRRQTTKSKCTPFKKVLNL